MKVYATEVEYEWHGYWHKSLASIGLTKESAIEDGKKAVALWKSDNDSLLVRSLFVYEADLSIEGSVLEEIEEVPLDSEE